jgi:hypothetical protein
MTTDAKLESAGPLWISTSEYKPGGDINLKMIGLDYRFDCGLTAKEVLLNISKTICSDCIVDPMCNVVCPHFIFAYREIFQWLNNKEDTKVSGLEVLEVLMEIAGDKKLEGNI